MVGVFVVYIPEGQAARDVKKSRECAICHIAWIADFSRDDVTTLVPYNPTPSVATGKQDIVSSERVCISCHDGFVRDSRYLLKNMINSHPVGVVPSKHVSLPMQDGKNLFPLNHDGRIYCGTCHSAHGVKWGEKSVFLRMDNKNSAMCVACHLDRTAGPKQTEHPVFVELEKLPEGLLAAGSKFGDNNTVICQSCHRIHGAPEKKLLMVKNDNSNLCGNCHSDRYAQDLPEAQGMRSHPVNIDPINVVIPQEITELGGKLGGGTKIICQTCHRPHFAQRDSHILVASNAESSLCMKCHTDKRMVAESKHNMKFVDSEMKNVRDQKVGTSGVCSACHLPHGGQGAKMWARVPGESNDPLAQLCVGCHSAGGPAEKKLVGDHTHPVGRDISLMGPSVELPGYGPNGYKSVGDGKGKVTCPSCHDPHQWDSRDPEKTSRPGDKATSLEKFLRKPLTPDSSLCLTCHLDKKTVINTKHDIPKMAPGDEGVVGLEASKAGLCGNCHRPHNGNGPRMWARSRKVGVDPVASTCLSCHDDGRVARKKLIGAHTHPTGVPIKRVGIDAGAGVWSGKLTAEGLPPVPMPLFDETGNRTLTGGNVSCGTCHDPHKWSVKYENDPYKHPEDVEGDWGSRFLRIPLESKAVLCGNCHSDKWSVKLSKHNMEISAPDSENALGQSPSGATLCGSCHLPHKGRGAKMWARDSGPGHDEIEKRCTSCHQEKGAAKRKQIGNTHPIGADPKAIGADPDLPLFLEDGKRDAEKGRVSCGTCHDVHQWDYTNPKSEAGADAKVEGDAKDSFLRKPAIPTPVLCFECHNSKRWVKGTKHDMSVVAPKATNVLGQTIEQSGMCGQCHVPHNAQAKLLIWARKLGPADDGIEKYCRSCHSKGQMAENKQPFKVRHPPQVNVVATKGRNRVGQLMDSVFPLYTADGVRAQSGVISCPTCHNPHQWRPGKPAEGSGRKDEEGNALSSFLRNPSDYILCADCHGLDSLFRYKYFHGKTSRVKHNLVR